MAYLGRRRATLKWPRFQTSAASTISGIGLGDDPLTGGDQLTVLTVLVSLADSAAAVDSIDSVLMPVALAGETGTGTDTLVAGQPKPLTGETGTATESLTIPVKPVAQIETVSIADDLGVNHPIVLPGAVSLVSTGAGVAVLSSSGVGVVALSSPGVGVATLDSANDGKAFVTI